MIAWGVGLWSVATGAGAFVARYWQLFVSRALVGVGEAGYAPASQAIIAEYYRGKARAFAIGVYSAGMALGGILGVWIGGVIAERWGWRAAFLCTGVPGLLFAFLGARIREPDQRAPGPIRATLERWARLGVSRAVRFALPLAGGAALGAVLAGILELFRGVRSEVVIAVFGLGVVGGAVWSLVRLVPVAVHQTQEAEKVAATALEEFVRAAAIVLRTPTLVWIFIGGAMVTFAVNGLIAWAATFMARVHGYTVAQVGREFGLWGLLGGVLGALFGGRVADLLQTRWPGGRVLTSGIGFILGGPVCAALLLVNDTRAFVPLVLGTYFLYTWYNGPLAAVIFDVVPAAVRASVLGAFVLFSHLAGDALAPPLVGYISDRTQSLRTAMLILPLAGVVGGGVILGALRTVGRDMRRLSA